MATRDYTSLITSEHQQPKFIAMVQALAGGIGDIANFITALPAQFDLDGAVGAQLDIVGQWIGQSRTVPGIPALGFFGFSDNLAASTFGEEGKGNIGGRFYEEGEPFVSTAVLADVEYRLILRAKIVRNQYQGTTKEIEAALQYIFGVPAHIRDPGNWSIDVVVNGSITAIGQALLTTLDLLPRPAGVAISSIIFSQLTGEARDQASATAHL